MDNENGPSRSHLKDISRQVRRVARGNTRRRKLVGILKRVSEEREGNLLEDMDKDEKA